MTFVQIDNRNAFRLFDANGVWLGTVWQHVCGFAWARLHPWGGMAAGDDVGSMEEAKAALFARIESERLAA